MSRSLKTDSSWLMLRTAEGWRGSSCCNSPSSAWILAAVCRSIASRSLAGLAGDKQDIVSVGAGQLWLYSSVGTNQRTSRASSHRAIKCVPVVLHTSLPSWPASTLSLPCLCTVCHPLPPNLLPPHPLPPDALPQLQSSTVSVLHIPPITPNGHTTPDPLCIQASITLPASSIQIDLVQT